MRISQTQWRPLPPMLESRSALSACVVHDTVFAIGGQAGGTHDSMEALDMGTMTWRMVAGRYVSYQPSFTFYEYPICSSFYQLDASSLAFINHCHTLLFLAIIVKNLKGHQLEILNLVIWWEIF